MKATPPRNRVKQGIAKQAIEYRVVEHALGGFAGAAGFELGNDRFGTGLQEFGGAFGAGKRQWQQVQLRVAFAIGDFNSGKISGGRVEWQRNSLASLWRSALSALCRRTNDGSANSAAGFFPGTIWRRR